MKAKDVRINTVSVFVSRLGGRLRLAVFLCFAALGLMAFVPSGHATIEQHQVSAEMKKATYVGTETCVTCHEKAGREFKLSTHARISNDKVTGSAQGCEMCHGPGSVHAEASGGKDNIINPRKNPEICFTCHMEKKMEFKLPYHHPVLEGKMSCADCHELHGEDAKPWSTTSVEDVNEKCFKCHKDQRGPFVWEHQGVREGCTACHKVHGSIHEKMLVVRDYNLCLRCHAQSMNSAVGNDNHTGDWTRGTCWSAGCHTSVHGSNFDYHFRY